MEKMCYIYTMEYYLAMKEKEVLPFVKTWMDLEGIRLSEINQKKSSNTVWYHLHIESEKVKLKNGCRMVFSRGRGWGDGEMSVRVQTCSYKPSKFWVSNVQHGGYS